jgi:hypothetical protein
MSCSFHVRHLHDDDVGNEEQHCATEWVQKHDSNGKKEEIDRVNRTYLLHLASLQDLY